MKRILLIGWRIMNQRLCFCFMRAKDRRIPRLLGPLLDPLRDLLLQKRAIRSEGAA
jgi:hypothetical protein